MELCERQMVGLSPEVGQVLPESAKKPSYMSAIVNDGP